MATVLFDGPFLGSGGVYQLVVSHRLNIASRLRLPSPLRRFSGTLVSANCLIGYNLDPCGLN